MFTHPHEEHSVVATRPSPFTVQARLTRWAAWCGSAAMAVATAGALVLVISQVVFGREPIGGAFGLALLYLETAVAGIGLAVLDRILPIARRSPEPAPAARFPMAGSPPEARTETRDAA
jgi:hypothetical protein